MNSNATRTPNPCSPKQANFLRSLLDEKQHDENAPHVLAKIDDGTLSKGSASALISRLLACPRKPREQKSFAKVEVGFYDVKGTIFKVQPSRSNPDRTYAKELQERADGSPEWIYARGALREIAQHGRRLTLDEAKQYGQTHGFCLACGRLLTDPESIANGIGPICASKF